MAFVSGLSLSLLQRCLSQNLMQPITALAP